MIFWIPAFNTLFLLLKNKMPWYASIGYLIAIFGCISGANFGMVGVFSEAFGIAHQTFLVGAARYPLAFDLLFFWSGPLFPLSLLALGINLAIKKTLPAWTALLICLGAIAFPLSRIPRLEIVAHVADILLLIPLVFTGISYLSDQLHQHPSQVDSK